MEAGTDTTPSEATELPPGQGASAAPKELAADKAVKDIAQAMLAMSFELQARVIQML